MRINFSKRTHLLFGSFREIVESDQSELMLDWLEDVTECLKLNHSWQYSEIIRDAELAAFRYQQMKDKLMPPKRKRPNAIKKSVLQLPTARSIPETSPWQYAYHVCGERKIGKTTLAISGCEELVIQFDKPQLAYEVREMVPVCWSDRTGRKLGFEQILARLEAIAADENEEFIYERIVIDGVAEWYQMCMEYACKKNGVGHPSEDENWGRTWTLMRETFTDAVNRLLRLQSTAKCGLFFISHTEWRERTARGTKQKILKLESDLPGRCEKIINGKVDAWFVYDYEGEDRVLFVLGSQEIGAGHRIDGHFKTIGGDRISEIYMGNDSTDAQYSLDQFMKAFNNKLEYKNIKARKIGLKNAQSNSPKRKRRKRSTT